MLKKLLYTVLFVVLASGAVYSWQKVDFNRKTAMFFQVVFGGENSMGGPGGRPPRGDIRRGDMSHPQPWSGQAMGAESQAAQSGLPQMMGKGGDRWGIPSDFKRRGHPGERFARHGGPRGGGEPGGYVSLGKVAKYTIIMAFITMLTILVDRGVRGISRSRKARAV